MAKYQASAWPLIWLVELFADAGWARPSETGEIRPLGWADIQYWIEGSGQQHIPVFWRCAVIALSEASVAQAKEAREMECPAPLEPE